MVSPEAASQRAWNGVKIGPGPTEFTRIPSRRMVRGEPPRQAAIAALMVSYCRLPPPAMTDRTEAVLTMTPPPMRRISGTAALAQET
jgi:hypothetical protein